MIALYWFDVVLQVWVWVIAEIDRSEQGERGRAGMGSNVANLGEIF